MMHKEKAECVCMFRMSSSNVAIAAATCRRRGRRTYDGWAVHSRLVGVGLPLRVVGVWRVEDVRAAHILLFNRRRNSRFSYTVVTHSCSGAVKVRSQQGVSSVQQEIPCRQGIRSANAQRRSHTALRLGAWGADLIARARAGVGVGVGKTLTCGGRRGLRVR
jgi:hypothetical protein